MSFCRISSSAESGVWIPSPQAASATAVLILLKNNCFSSFCQKSGSESPPLDNIKRTGIVGLSKNHCWAGRRVGGNNDPIVCYHNADGVNHSGAINTGKNSQIFEWAVLLGLVKRFLRNDSDSGRENVVSNIHVLRTLLSMAL